MWGKNLQQVFEHELIESDSLHEVAATEDDIAELRIVEDMRLDEEGRGDIQRVADVGEIAEKFPVSERLLFFIGALFYDVVVLVDLCPNSKHTHIIQNAPSKGKLFHAFSRAVALKSS